MWQHTGKQDTNIDVIGIPKSCRIEKKKEKLMKAALYHVINVSNTFGTVASLSMLYKIKKSKQNKQGRRL